MNCFCEMCKKPIVGGTSRQRFCKACARVRFLEKKKEWHRQGKLRRQQQGEPPRKQQQKKPVSGLTAAVREAEAAGLSYGQYMAVKQSQQYQFATYVKARATALDLVMKK